LILARAAGLGIDGPGELSRGLFATGVDAADGTNVDGFRACLPDRVWVFSGMNSSDEAREDGSDGVSGSLDSSELTLFRFFRGCGATVMVCSVALGDSALSSVASFDLRGPRLIPGLPRPRPFPEVATVPSGSIYERCCFLLEVPGVRAEKGGNALGGKVALMLSKGYDAGACPSPTVGLTAKLVFRLILPGAVAAADDPSINVESGIREIASGACPGAGEALTLKVDIPGGVVVDCDAATPFTTLVTFESFVGIHTCGDLTRVNVFSLCRNGCEGTVPDRGARFVDKVERTSAFVRDVSAAFISPENTGRTG
jgi:hypothetical protein